MSGNKRHRVELDAYSYETLRYFGLLQGRPVGHVLRRALAIFAETVEKENPPVRAHMLSMRAAATARGDDALEEALVPF